jgi:hypothetical protein
VLYQRQGNILKPYQPTEDILELQRKLEELEYENGCLRTALKCYGINVTIMKREKRGDEQ